MITVMILCRHQTFYGRLWIGKIQIDEQILFLTVV